MARSVKISGVDWTFNRRIMIDVDIARSINVCIISGSNNKEMWQFAKHLEDNGYHPIEIIYLWRAEKPRLKVHGLNLTELQNELKQEAEKWNLENE